MDYAVDTYFTLFPPCQPPSLVIDLQSGELLPSGIPAPDPRPQADLNLPIKDGSVQNGGGSEKDHFHGPSSLEIDRTFQQSSLSEEIKEQNPLPRCCVGGLVNYEEGKFIPLRCKSWACPDCGPRNGRKVAARLRAAGVNFNRMVTLPFKIGEDRTWKEAINESGKVLNLFLTSVRREFPGLKYVWVREIGRKSNMVHFHVMVSHYLSQAVISRLWERSGGGCIVDVRRVGMGYALKYLVKYCPYTPEVLEVIKGKRRWSCSRWLLIPLPRSQGTSLWYFITKAPWQWPWCNVYGVEDGVWKFVLV